jgi:hypothetical protein
MERGSDPQGRHVGPLDNQAFSWEERGAAHEPVNRAELQHTPELENMHSPASPAVMGWTPPAQELLLASSACEPFTHTRGAIMSKLRDCQKITDKGACSWDRGEIV